MISEQIGARRSRQSIHKWTEEERFRGSWDLFSSNCFCAANGPLMSIQGPMVSVQHYLSFPSCICVSLEHSEGVFPQKQTVFGPVDAMLNVAPAALTDPRSLSVDKNKPREAPTKQSSTSPQITTGNQQNPQLPPPEPVRPVPVFKTHSSVCSSAFHERTCSRTEPFC